MAVSILTRRQSKIGSLTIEATLSENHSMTSTVTKFPVEGGVVVSDHIVNDPEKISLDCFISNTPLNGSTGNFAQDAFDQLNQMWLTKELITVVSHYKVYSDMAITDISVPRNAASGHAIQFTVELLKIRKVESTTVSVQQSNVASSVVDQAASRINTGQTTTKPADATQVSIANQKLLSYKMGLA